MELPLGRSAYDRTYGKGIPVELINRFFETDPTNSAEGVALLTRPGTTFENAFGVGPIRAIWAQEGTFEGAAFIVSGNQLWRYDKDKTKTALIGNIADGQNPRMDGTEDYLFITDGTTLQYYNGIGNFAEGIFIATDNLLSGATVTLGSDTYTFVDTLNSAYDVLRGADAEESLENLVLAINAETGTGAGTKFGLDTEPNEEARAVTGGSAVTPGDQITAIARDPGTAGNSVGTTAVASNGDWEAATLENGTNDALNGIVTPDDVGIKSLAVIGGFVLCSVAESDLVYFIRPPTTEGELPTIDPLDFFRAESSPDKIIELKRIGDRIAMYGEKTTEYWYLSGQGTVPFDRIKGQAFSRGVVEGTVASLGTRIFVVGDNDIVYITGAGLQRISTHAIEEKIRLARQAERDNP